MRWLLVALGFSFAAYFGVAPPGRADPKPPPAAIQKPYALAQLRSGASFMAPHLQAQQRDDDQNPGMLWVDQGRDLFAADCARCHDAEAQKRLAAKLPRVTPNGPVVTLETQINRCQTDRVKRADYPLESQPLLALSSYLSFAARGEVYRAQSDVTSTEAWQRGRNAFTQVQGKLDFSCAACHDQMAGKRVRTQAISQGHGVGFPAYRVEWQGVGSLNRRLRACYFGMETLVPAQSDPILADLALYLAWRSEGLPLEAPAVRR